MRNRYLFLNEISHGAFGRVHLALDQATGRQVAVKELIELTPDARERFNREARMLYRELNNRYVVDLLDHDLGHDPPYIVLEYCEHGSLRTWVQERRPWRQVAGALSHVLQGLEGIHRLGGFHRDIKPENILVASAPEGGFIVKVADFGLARTPVTETGTLTQTGAGTPGYIAPEILVGKPFTAAADVYSLGVVATEMLTGSCDSEELRSQELPHELRELVLAMVSMESSSRPKAAAIARGLRDILAPVKPPITQPRSSSTGLSALVVGGLALAGLAALASGARSEWDEDVERYRGRDGKFKKR